MNIKDRFRFLRSETLGRRKNELVGAVKTTDKLMLFICIVISVFSCLLMYSIYYSGLGSSRIVSMQSLCAVLGLIAAIVVSLLDYHDLVKMWPIMVGVSVALILALKIPGLAYRPEGSDDWAWIRIGSFSFQPSELLKLVFVYTFSYHLSKVRHKINFFSTFALLCVHGAIPVLLIMDTGDFGSALVFFFTFIIMMFVAGLSWKLIVIGLGGIGVAIPLVWKILPAYLKRRFEVAWNPSIDPLGDGYQQYRGQVALGSGQLTGRGLFADHLYSVPECYNDFIFSYIGQTLGFIGCMITVFLLVVLMVKILFTAKKSKDDLGMFICIGVFAIIAFQVVINIGMVLCIFPVIGITLPFISYGGTSLVISYASIGMVLGVYRHNYYEMIFD